MKAKIQLWLSKWRLKRIILALHRATEYGLRPQVVEFARSLEASEAMTRDIKKHEFCTIVCKREDLAAFVTYMSRLHSGKLSLLVRARIGLIALLCKDQYVTGEPVDQFIIREFGKVKRSKDDHRIITLNK